MRGQDELEGAVGRCLFVLGARATAFAVGLDSSAPVLDVARASASLDDDARTRVLALAEGIAVLHGDWGDDGVATCLWGMCPILDDRAALAVLRDGDLAAFGRAVDYYAMSWYTGQGS